MIEESATPTFRINMKKLNVETALVVGNVTELMALANLFKQHGDKAIDLRERKVLEKVVQTLLARHSIAQAKVFKLAKKCGAAEIIMPAPEGQQ